MPSASAAAATAVESQVAWDPTVTVVELKRRSPTLSGAVRRHAWPTDCPDRCLGDSADDVIVAGSDGGGNSDPFQLDCMAVYGWPFRQLTPGLERVGLCAREGV